MVPTITLHDGFDEADVLPPSVPLIDGALVEERTDLVRLSLRHTKGDEPIPNVPRERVLPLVVDELPTTLSRRSRISCADSGLASVKASAALP